VMECAPVAHAALAKLLESVEFEVKNTSRVGQMGSKWLGQERADKRRTQVRSGDGSGPLQALAKLSDVGRRMSTVQLHRSAGSREQFNCMMGPVKTAARAAAKVRDKAVRKKVSEMEIASSLYDVVRASIIADDPFTLAMTVLAIASRPEVEVVKVKNGFKEAGDWLKRGKRRRARVEQNRGGDRGRGVDPGDEVPTSLPFVALMLHLRIKDLAEVPGGSFLVEIQGCLAQLAEFDKGDKHLLFECTRFTCLADLVKQRVFTKGEVLEGPAQSSCDVKVAESAGRGVEEEFVKHGSGKPAAAGPTGDGPKPAKKEASKDGKRPAKKKKEPKPFSPILRDVMWRVSKYEVR